MSRTRDEAFTVRGDMEQTMQLKLEQANSQIKYMQARMKDVIEQADCGSLGAS